MSKSTNGGRRTFLKVGAGVVGGLVVGGVVAYAAKSATTTTSTQMVTQTSTLPPITSTQTQTVTAPPVTSTATQTVTAPPVTSTSTVTSTAPPVTSTVTSTSTTTNTTAEASELTAYSGIADGLISLSLQEAAVVTAAANAIIPADSNGPGATQAGVIYFIDRQLWGEYGSNAHVYSQGPFIPQGLTGSLTVNGLVNGVVTPITYTGGTPAVAWGTPQRYEYPMRLREFWRFGIEALEAYSNSAYGGNFETLSAANQVAALSDLFNNKPTTFGTDSSGGNAILPSDFANELFYMVWAGFITDPMYGGNRGMVGWKLTAMPGLNSGNFYGEGQTPIGRATASTPTILGPVSNAQFQQTLKVSGVLSP